MSTAWQRYLKNLHDILRMVSIRDAEGREMDPDQGLDLWVEMAWGVKHAGGCAYFIGNGASASMACHFSTDVSKNAKIRSQVFTDPALLTAMANDIHYDDVFSEPLSWLMQPKDMLVAISSSGNSPNIVKAVRTARGRGGKIVSLSAMSPDNQLRSLGDLNIFIAAPTYGLAESGHAAIMHHWTDMLVHLNSGQLATDTWTTRGSTVIS
jgi:D-sedoheptulose 7-phosphate isomerase